MKKQILKSPGGLWYAQYDPTIVHPMNRLAVVCLGGSGEYGSYSAADMNAEVSRIVEKNGFAQDAINGEELPFVIIAPLATKGKDIADHSLIAAEIGNIVELLDVDYRIIGGLSYGGQTTSGFLFQSKNNTEIQQKQSSSFKKAEIFDGFFMLAPRISYMPEACAFPLKRVFIAHAIGDTSIRISESFKIVELANSCPDRTEKIYSNYQQKFGTTGPYYVPIEVPSNAINKLWAIPGGNHGTSWTETYNWRGPEGTAGYEFRKWVERIVIPKVVDTSGKIVLREGKVMAIFDDGTTKELTTI